MTMHHGGCHWSRALYQVLVRMLVHKRPRWLCSKADQRLTRVSLSCIQEHFLGIFSLLYLELSIINFQTKRIKTEMLFKLSNLNSNLVLTLGCYLSPALNNSVLFCLSRFCDIYCTVILRYSFALRVISDILRSSCFESYGPKDTR